MLNDLEQILIAYGSESGNAESLAKQLNSNSFPTQIKIDLVELNKVQLTSLNSKVLLLIITSTFGDGEPPGNADTFLASLEDHQKPLPFQYAVFALGDVAYSNFCRFGQQLDLLLSEKGATRIINRVDADLDYRAFFAQWANTLNTVLEGNNEIGHQLNLQVKPYNEATPHIARIIEVKKLNIGEPGVYSVLIDITGSNMNYRAGDLLYIIPPSQPEQLLNGLSAWFNVNVTEQLKDKELRLISKSTLRTLAKKSKNSELKEKLKTKNKQALADYLYGRDILDILEDCENPEFISLDELTQLLPKQTPRAYSISSSGIALDDQKGITTVSLCIRDIAYELNTRLHVGTCSHYLANCKSGDELSVFIRSNPEFHLDDDLNVPIIMIGAGTGIAPYIGFLQQRQIQESRADAALFFGERNTENDFLYKYELDNWLEQYVLTELITAFSRDQAQKYYVQDAMVKNGSMIWDYLQRGAIIYVCGSKDNLAKPIDQALINIAQEHGGLSFEQAEQNIMQLSATDRYRKDLY